MWSSCMFSVQINANKVISNTVAVFLTESLNHVLSIPHNHILTAWFVTVSMFTDVLFIPDCCSVCVHVAVVFSVNADWRVFGECTQEHWVQLLRVAFTQFTTERWRFYSSGIGSLQSVYVSQSTFCPRFLFISSGFTPDSETGQRGEKRSA